MPEQATWLTYPNLLLQNSNPFASHLSVIDVYVKLLVVGGKGTDKKAWAFKSLTLKKGASGMM